VLKRDLSEAEEDGTCTLETKCPYCEVGKITMKVNLQFLTVIVQCPTDLILKGFNGIMYVN
jgi:hypothetical protein